MTHPGQQQRPDEPPGQWWPVGHPTGQWQTPGPPRPWPQTGTYPVLGQWQPPPPPPPPKPRAAWLIPAVVAAVVLAVTAGVTVMLLNDRDPIAASGSVATSTWSPSTSSTPPATSEPTSVTPEADPTFNINGTLTLNDTTGYNISSGSSCNGKGGFADITTGTQVVIKDGAGTTLAFGTLGEGTGGSTSCIFAFAISDIPRGVAIYALEVGNRGALNFTEATLEAGPQISIG